MKPAARTSAVRLNGTTIPVDTCELAAPGLDRRQPQAANGRMKWGILAIAALAGFSASAQSIVDIDLPAVDIGRYSSSGEHTAASQNYLTGRAGGETYAGFAVFSVPDMAGSAQKTTSVTGPFGSWQRRADLDGSPLLPPIPLGPAYPYVWEWVGVMRTTRTTEKWQQSLTGANLTLSFANPGTMTSAGDTLTVFDVSTPAAQVRQGGAGKVGIYADLSSGTQFGGVIPPAGPFSVALNANAGTAFTAVAQAGGFLTLGLSLPGAQDGEFVFGFTGSIPIGVTLQGSVEGVRTDLPTETFIQDVADVAWVVNGPSRVPLFDGTLWYTDAPGMEPGFTPTIVPEPMAAPLAVGLLALGYGLRRRILRSRPGNLSPVGPASLTAT